MNQELIHCILKRHWVEGGDTIHDGFTLHQVAVPNTIYHGLNVTTHELLKYSSKAPARKAGAHPVACLKWCHAEG